MRSSWIEIDLDALRRNTELILTKLGPNTRLMAPVKGNAYGHGAVRCSKTFLAAGASDLGVAIPEEGAELRQAGIRAPILIFGYTFPDDYDLLFDYDLTPNVFTLDQAEELSRMAVRRGRALTIHVSVDTGLHRLGFDLPEAEESIRQVCALPGLRVEGIFSMFATGYQYPDTAYCYEQFRRFVDLCSRLEAAGVRIPIRHICDSGATLLFPEMHLDMVRPGTFLYGTDCGEAPDIRGEQVMTVKSKLACVRTIAAGETVGYDRSWTARRPSVIGVAPIGFVDGTSRIASNRGAVLLHGQRCPIVGNICMDQMMLDITDVASPRVGDEIVLTGRQGEQAIGLVEAGAFGATTDTEYICRQGSRLPLYYRENGVLEM